jgi:Uncharacterized protein conserved in bacteria (DUF2252)
VSKVDASIEFGVLDEGAPLELRHLRRAGPEARLQSQRLRRDAASTLARAHARSGDRIVIAAYLGRGDAFDRATATFADQNERDYRARWKGRWRRAAS